MTLFRNHAILGALLMSWCSSGVAKGPTAQLVTATVDVSEWAPSNTLALDLISGRYVVSQPPTPWLGEHPPRAARDGKVDGRRLAAIRIVADQAFKVGLRNRLCPPPILQDLLRERDPSEKVYISVSDNKKKIEDYELKFFPVSCWTKEAGALYQMMSDMIYLESR